ncbi:MAG: hypothetical protein EBY61_06025, partial [Actinobacteria bacterium]|nr:hypothetical protein [Actinomycetota bacterium]
AASDLTGERVWHLPLPADYRKQVESSVADMKNIGGPHGGALTAGLILQEFVADGIPWAHLDIAAQIGVGHRGGRNSPLSRSIQRAIRFGAARSAGADSIEVRHRLAPLNRSQIERLPLALQAEHQHLHEQPVTAGPARSRARRLALSLIECGDGFAETERQLDQWRVPGPIAAEAVNWAWERHRIAAEHGPEAA